MASSLKIYLPEFHFEYGYLEFACPTITEALDRLVNKSVKRIIAIPAMLFAAGHAKNDIPSLLRNYSEENGVNIEYGRELGLNNLMIGAAGGRINELINKSRPFSNSETLLVVVGRGSADPDANSNVCKITRMLVEGFGFGWGETVFSGVTFPLVEPGLRHLVRLGFKRIIVFPYFLFSGVLINRIRDHTDIVAREFPEIEFLEAGYLGNHPLVLETFQERIEEVFRGSNNMNCLLCKYRSKVIGFEDEVGLSQVSHHHHVEGLMSNSSISQKDSYEFFADEIDGNKDKNTDDHIYIDKAGSHSHHHYPYPNSQHPLGPLTLRKDESSNSKEK